MNDLLKKNTGFNSDQRVTLASGVGLDREKEGLRRGKRSVITERSSQAQALESLTTEQFLGLIGARVRKHRSDINMSRKALAKTSGVSERYLAQLESGNGNISIGLLRKVAGAIGVKMEQLMAEETLMYVGSDSLDHS